MKKIKSINRQLLAILIVISCLNNITIAQVFNPIEVNTTLLPSGLKVASLFVDNRYDSNKSFIVIFRDTLIEPIEPTENKEKEIGVDFLENERKVLIEKNSVNTSGAKYETVWTLDTILAGRRCYAMAFSGTLFPSLFEHFSKNMINFNFPENIHTARSFDGIIIYISENAGWVINLKTKE